MTAMHRDDAGHFAGNTEPFRHWDAEGGVVPNTCVKCHTATGLADVRQQRWLDDRSPGLQRLPVLNLPQRS